MVSLIPSLAAWAKLQIDNSLARSPAFTRSPEMIASMKQVGIMYHGLSILGGGSILAGVVLGATTVFIVDRDFAKAAGFAAAGAVLTFFGLMHGEEVGAFQNPEVVIAYFAVAGSPARVQPLRGGCTCRRRRASSRRSRLRTGPRSGRRTPSSHGRSNRIVPGGPVADHPVCCLSMR